MTSWRTIRRKYLQRENIPWLEIFGISVTIIPAIGYLITYLHELGYFSAFEAPTELINPTNSTILISVASTLIALIPMLWFFVIQMNTKKEIKADPFQSRLAYFMTTLIFIMMLSIRYLLINELIYTLILIAIIAVMLFLFPFITQRKVKGYKNKLASEDESSKIDALNLRKHRYIFLSGFLLGWALISSYLGGRSDALNRTTFNTVTTDNGTAIVLRIYGNELICEYFDPATEKVSHSFFIILLDDVPRPILTSITINKDKK